MGWGRGALFGPVVSLPLAFALLGAAGSSRAADFEDFLSHDFGGFTLQPQMDVSEAYTDNLTYTKGRGRIAELQSTFSPGLRVQRGSGQSDRGSLEYMHDETVFLEHPDFNYRQEHLKATGLFTTPRLVIEPTENFEKLSGFLGGVIGQSGFINFAPRRRDVWSGTLRTTYLWTDRTRFYGDFSHYQTDWAPDVPLYDYNTLRGAFGGSYEATDRIQVFGEASYGQSGVTANQAFQTPGVASATYGSFLGVRGEFTTRFSGTAKVGMEARDFFQEGRQTVLIPAFDLDLRFQFSEVTTSTLQYSRRTSPSLNLGGQNVTSDSISLGTVHTLDEAAMWSLRGTAAYQLADYDNTAPAGRASTARVDDFVTAELGLYYQPRPWITTSAGYAFEHYQVSFANPLLALRNLSGYQANRVFVNLSLGF